MNNINKDCSLCFGGAKVADRIFQLAFTCYFVNCPIDVQLTAAEADRGATAPRSSNQTDHRPPSCDGHYGMFIRLMIVTKF